MKLSLILTNGGWHANEILKEAKKRGITTNIVRITTLNDTEKRIKELGDVTIWLSSFLKTLDKKSTFFNLLKDKILMNKDCSRYPFLTRKLFQQKYLKANSSLNCIPTFCFQDKNELLEYIASGKLKFPIIQKPNVGSQGDNITMLSSEEDIKKTKVDISKYIYQNFIPNDGDYRIFVVGGKALGAIKRTAKPGNFLNNVSKGGIATNVEDPEIFKTLRKMALAAASAFDLPICGVDIIFDQEEKKYYLMEINVNPEWKGFQRATGINVAGEIVDYCLSLYKRKTTRENVASLIQEYFDQNYQYLAEQKFHYASRMYLWTKDKFYKKKLEELRSSYLGNTSEEKISNLKKSLKHQFDCGNLIAGELRERYFRKYPELVAYNNILFKYLFAKTIYQEDLKPLIKNLISDKQFLDLKNRLEKDKKAIAALSTFAVNYFYILSYYFKKPSMIEPKLFLDIFKKKNAELLNHTDLKIYLLTHAIIGESAFYSQTIKRKRKVYLEMIKTLENLIREDYFAFSLDTKFEFLVCCQLCNYQSGLKSILLDEAKRSLAENGNFLISKLNDSQGFFRRNISDAEHRNVLFIMANKKPIL